MMGAGIGAGIALAEGNKRLAETLLTTPKMLVKENKEKDSNLGRRITALKAKYFERQV